MVVKAYTQFSLNQADLLAVPLDSFSDGSRIALVKIEVENDLALFQGELEALAQVYELVLQPLTI